MLTVDYEKFELAPATSCSTSVAASVATPMRPLSVAPMSSVATWRCPARGDQEHRPMLIDDAFGGQLMHTQVQGDGTRLPYPDNTFDKIIASEVLEHIPDDVTAYDEFFASAGRHARRHRAATFPRRSAGSSATSTTPRRPRAATSASTPRTRCARSSKGGFDPGRVREPRPALAVLVDPVAVGVNNEVDDNWSVKQYHKLLEDIVSQPVDHPHGRETLNPVLGKSLVVKATKSPLRTEKLSQVREAADASTDLPGLITADQIRATAAHIADWQLPSGMILVPRRARRPWRPHQPPWRRHRRASGRGRGRLPVAGRLPAPGRLVAPVLPRARDRAGQARRQRHRLHRGRDLAHALLSAPRLHRVDVAGGRQGDGVRARSPAAG